MPTDNPIKRPQALWPRLAIAGLFIGGLIAFFSLGGDDYLSLTTIKDNRDALLAYSEQHYLALLAIAALVYTVSTALSIPGGVLLSLTVGFLFGRWIGTAVIVVAATAGAGLVFLAARYLFAEAAQKRAGGLARRLIDGFQDNAFSYLLFLRLVPLFPFWLVNLVPAFTPMPLRHYLLATAIGILPGSFVFANLGQSLGRIESLDQLVSSETLLAFGLLGAFALIPVLAKRRKEKTASLPDTPSGDTLPTAEHEEKGP